MTGDLAKVYRALNKPLEQGTIVGYGDVNPINAEARPGALAGWYIVETHPAHERIAAGHLSGRRFGVYVPEAEEIEIRRGRKIRATRPMFPGYLFIFTWGIQDHVSRIEACPGVFRLMLQHDPETWAPRFVMLPDEAIDEIRKVENGKRPLVMPADAFREFAAYKKKRRWRRTKMPDQRQEIHDNQIVSVRAWSAFTDGLRQSVDGEQRNQILRKAFSLPS
jgi:transcription antitermination factor NusG